MDVFFSKDSKSQDRGEDTFLSYFVHKHLRIAGVSIMAFFSEYHVYSMLRHI